MKDHIADNQLYYFRVGKGTWTGRFSFHIENWRAFWRDRIGLKNRFLALSMVIAQKLLGTSTIVSTMRAFPEWGPNGVATNMVRIKKLGVTMYLLKEQYVLDPDGTKVYVHSRERFGPIPFLFRMTKRHPARVHNEGRGSTYLDMPLLGTLWEGDYQVLEDQDHIDAKLTCEWAAAREIISRISSRSEIDLTIPETHNHITDLDGVIDRLRRYRDWYEAVRDPMAVFTHAYVKITEIFREEIPKTNFEDRDWILALDVAFAREYFRALDAYDLGEQVPKGWHPVFDAIRDGHTSVLEELILSMAAHIIYDLPLALREVHLRQGSRSRVRDFYLANDVLERGIDQIQREVGQRYNPFLIWLDRVGAREDEVLTNYGIRLSRAVAWFNGERLADPKSEKEARASIGRSIKIVVQQLRRPPLLSLRILLRLARWMSRSKRVWPGHQVL